MDGSDDVDGAFKFSLERPPMENDRCPERRKPNIRGWQTWLDNMLIFYKLGFQMYDRIIH